MTAEPWVPDPEARPDYGADAEQEQVCECGHPDWLHTKPEGVPGDCLHRSQFDSYDCHCETFRPKEDA